MFELETFAASLRAARKERGLSQQQLAEQLHLSTQAVSKWEQGKSAPDVFHLQRLAQILHISVDTLLGVEPMGEDALIAVDGGGTKTEFVLTSLQGVLLRRLVLEGSNPNACTVEGAFAVLRRGIDALMQEDCRVLGIYIGGSGMGSAGNGEAVEKMLRDIYPRQRICCRTDIGNVLAMGADPDNTIAVISGTGSVAYATCDGQLRRFGGGGWRLDALGSGYGFGCMALAAALDQQDGIGPATVLTELVAKQLPGRVWDSIGRIYDASPSFVASFAPLVFTAWQQGDAVAAEIVEKNCARLAQLISGAAGYSPKAKQVLLGGGLLSGNRLFREKLTAMIPKHLKAVIPQYPQVWGACLQCARLVGIPEPSAELFMNKYLQEE